MVQLKNVEVEDRRATAIEVLVDDEGNLHGDAEDYNSLKGSGYYIVQRPEDVIAEHPEIVKEYQAAVTRLTKTQIKEAKIDKEGFIEIVYSDDAVVKFDKAGKLVSDGRSAEPEKPYEDFSDVLKAKILESVDKKLQMKMVKKLKILIRLLLLNLKKLVLINSHSTLLMVLQ